MVMEGSFGRYADFQVEVFASAPGLDVLKHPNTSCILRA